MLEMKCLRTILRMTRKDRLSNTHIRRTLGIEKTNEDIVLERRLLWFVHVETNSEMINASHKQDFEKSRGSGRHPKRVADAIQQQVAFPSSLQQNCRNFSVSCIRTLRRAQMLKVYF